MATQCSVVVIAAANSTNGRSAGAMFDRNAQYRAEGKTMSNNGKSVIAVTASKTLIGSGSSIRWRSHAAASPLTAAAASWP